MAGEAREFIPTQPEPAPIFDTMADWNRDIEARQATMKESLGQLSAEQRDVRAQELSRQISALEEQQREEFHREPADRKSPEHHQHIETITAYQRQIMLLQLERRMIEEWK